MQLKKRKIVSDVLLNFISALLPIIILQFIVYPIVARNTSNDEYGLMITIYSLLCMVAFSLGNVTNNIRLITQNKYEQSKFQGDFNVLLIVFSVVDIAIISFGTIFYEGAMDFVSIIMIVVSSILLLLDEYLEVYFRINLNFRKVLYNRFSLTIGYIVGTTLFIITKHWEFIYIGGQLASFLFLATNTPLLKEPLKTTAFFKETLKDCSALIGASLLSNAMNYADKLLLYPLIGGVGVAIYYAASLLGKMISMAISPVTSVVLSYISQYDSIKNHAVLKLLKYGVLICGVGYIATLIVTKPILIFLYPDWVNEAMEIVPVITLATIISAMCGLLNPFVLKFCKTSWQIVINTMSTIIYIVAALALISPFGLIGFCWGTVMGCASKLIIMLLVYFYVNRENTDEQI